MIKIGLVTPLCGKYDFGEYPETRTGLRMREFVHLSEVLRGEHRGADYLVVHRMPNYPGSQWPDIGQCLPVVEAKLGSPAYRDDQVVVFALSQLSPLGNSRRTVQQ